MSRLQFDERRPFRVRRRRGIIDLHAEVRPTIDGGTARDLSCRGGGRGCPASRDIANTLGRRLQLPVKSIAPEEAQAYFGWLARFATLDLPASGEQTRKKLQWQPTGRGLIADLEELHLPDR